MSGWENGEKSAFFNRLEEIINYAKEIKIIAEKDAEKKVLALKQLLETKKKEDNVRVEN